METNILIWLVPIGLLPIFFAMGWLAARVDMRTVLKQAKVVPIQFYKSLSAMVDGKTRVAADLLSEIVEEKEMLAQSPESHELALTLGQLFRKRGETNKAISLHQKMLSLPELSTEQSHQVRFELGKDYQAAGLVDRAETQLESLLETPLKSQASKILLLIYQQDRDWEKAIQLATLTPSEELSQQLELAQFHCELGQKALIQSKLELSSSYARLALEINKKCARANLILGDVFNKRQDYAEAIRAYTSIENQNYNYLSMVGEKIYDAYAAMSRAEEGLELLIGYAKTFPEINLTTLIYEKALLLWDRARANEITRQLIRLNPNLEKIYLLTTILLNDHQLALSSDAAIIEKVLFNQINKNFMYQCRHCYFKSQVFFWRCPACGRWETFTTRRIEV
ncbi:MAG: lipopolysaccharide assembly protein LapB [Neisseriaceae bacterium]